MLTILVVDDETDMEPLFRQRFRKELRAGQVAFQFELSGESALRYLEETGGVDLVFILSDINMPGMSGLELLKQIKADWPGISVFMVAPFEDEENRREGAAFGADGYLTKPINFDVLRTQILGLLDGPAETGADACT